MCISVTATRLCAPSFLAFIVTQQRTLPCWRRISLREALQKNSHTKRIASVTPPKITLPNISFLWQSMRSEAEVFHFEILPDCTNDTQKK